MKAAEDLDFFRYQTTRKTLKNFGVLCFKGPDAMSFLQGQLTSDVKGLEQGKGHETTRLNRTGKLQGWGFLLKEDTETFYLLAERSVCELLEEDLTQFIIMEEVEIKHTPMVPVLLTKARPDWGEVAERKHFFTGDFFNEDAAFLLDSSLESAESLEFGRRLSEEEFETLSLMAGYPSFLCHNELVTNTILNDLAVSYTKGCFLGQETASKITNNRGAAFYPVFLELNPENSDSCPEAETPLYVSEKKAGNSKHAFTWKGTRYLLASLARVYRVKERRFHFSVKDGVGFQGKVLYAPFFKDSRHQQKAHELYEEGLSYFREAESEEQEKVALELLQKSVEIDPKHSDAYEALGVIYGRHQDFEKAIDLMDSLLEVDPDSVMAHTNKSLYLMKLGKIEEAEEEKGLATVASFKQYGEESQAKRAEEEQKEQEEKELQDRERMFNEVLEIDPEDLIANFGLGDISYRRGQYEQAMGYLQKVLETDPKYSQAYLLLGKSYQALGKKEEAKDIFEKGVNIASSRGEMMPANEMQARLVEMTE